MLAWWGWSAAIVLVAFGALVAAVIASSAWSGEDVDGAGRKIARTTGAGALLGPTVAGLIAAFGATGLLMVLILVGTTPAFVTYVRTRWFAADDDPAPEPETEEHARSAEPAVEAQPDLGRLDDHALCLAWRRSFFQLEAARTAGARLSVVQQRQRYLDELHRRSPNGLAAWFASGARASGDPLPYVDENRRRIE